MKSIVDAVEVVVAERLGNWPPQWEGFHWPGYTYEHTQRVRSLALRMGEREGADPQVVELAALLHDIEKEAGREHAAAGAQTAERVLTELGVSPDLCARVTHVIATHTGDNTPEHPIENLVLGDADLIDANFGLVATWRFITIRAGHGTALTETITSMAEWLPKKEELRSLLHTEVGKAVTADRSVRMHDFCHATAAVLASGERNGEFDLVDLAEFIAARYETANLAAQLADLAPILREGRRPSAQVSTSIEALRAEIAGLL